MRTVSFIRPSFSLGLLIAALSQGGAISHDMGLQVALSFNRLPLRPLGQLR